MDVGQTKQAQNEGYLKMVGNAHGIQVVMHYYPWTRTDAILSFKQMTDLCEGQAWRLDIVVCAAIR